MSLVGHDSKAFRLGSPGRRARRCGQQLQVRDLAVDLLLKDRVVFVVHRDMGIVAHRHAGAGFHRPGIRGGLREGCRIQFVDGDSGWRAGGGMERRAARAEDRR